MRYFNILCLLCVLCGCEATRVISDDALNPPADTENGALIVFQEIPDTEDKWFCIFYQGKTQRLITIWDLKKREHIAQGTARLRTLRNEKQITFTLTQSDLETFLSYDLTWETIVEKVIECETAMEANTEANTETTVSYVWHANGAHDETLESGGVRLSNCSRPDPNRGEGILCPEVDSNENQHAHAVE